MKIIPILLFAASIASSQAAVVINIYQSGSNVLASGSGTINTASFGSHSTASWSGMVVAYEAMVFVGVSSDVFVYPIAGPQSFGSGDRFVADSNTGDVFGIYGNNLYTPASYSSGAQLSGTSTYNSKTIAALGMTPGTYTWTWGSGATADSAQLIVGTAPVPEPSACVLLGLGAAGLVARRRRTA